MDNERRREPQQHQYPDHLQLTGIDRLLIDIQKKLRDSYRPMVLENLTSFERKRIHTFFDSRPEFKTKTYRDNDNQILKVYPVGNLKKMAEEKAREVLETGKSIFLTDLGSFERFIVHEHLKNFEGIETISSGDDAARKLEIKRIQFGRSLKKIIKKIKLF